MIVQREIDLFCSLSNSAAAVATMGHGTVLPCQQAEFVSVAISKISD